MSKDRRSVEYDEGVENFINFALAHSTNHTSIKCPCLRCGNLLCQTPQLIREHLFFNGIDLSYRVWYWDGEKGLSGGFSNVSQQRYDKCEYNDVANTIDMVNAAPYKLILLGDMLPLNNEMPLFMYEAKKTFSALETAKHLMWHAKDKECDGKLCHPSDSSAWKLVDHMWPDFASEPRNLRLALSIDGPRQPGKNIDVYLSPLVDDLKTLWEKGVETYDAHLREVPEGYCSNFRNLISLEELKLFGLKSHDYHALMQQLLPVALRSVLPKHFTLGGCTHLRGTHAIGIPKSNNYDNKFGRPITGGRSTNIDHKSWLQAHHYVLENTTIVQPYIEEHMNWLKSQYPRQSKRQIWLQEEHMRCFTYWLKGKVEEAIHNGQDIPNMLRCGVSILAGTMQIASSKDKNLVFGELCFYGVINEIWDLDYNMFRIPIFKCDWVDNKNASQAKQVFYVEDQLDPKWSIVLSIPPKYFNNMEGLDDFTDNCMEHHPFISSMPEVESFDVMDESGNIHERRLTHVPIIVESWSKVPKETKEKLWDLITTSFNVNQNSKRNCFLLMGIRFRTFKYKLTKKYILPFKNDPEKLKKPPSIYPFIQEDHWRQFVKDRLSEHFNEYRKVQKSRRDKHIYNHYLGRKGYARFEQDILQVEGGIGRVDRSVLWKKAREKKGKFNKITEPVINMIVLIGKRLNAIIFE
ncbi:hypothetical protein CK203_102204 [Vitis vinifera]|uniref:Transposase-associated domain-containing protein n=1 Tax=Vitis vinifera TaxID=29760 RepID=A0A438DFH4_VITVI|nr:hypothetical protein CK203_102204 [Vitis vinifera]